MSNEYRRALFILLSVAALMMFAVGANAQDCDTCDPFANHCSDYCDRCRIRGIDYCVSWQPSTCGDNGACLTDNCTPSWSETSRVTQGTYDGVSWNSCNHHLVQWVTETDANQCNTYEAFWTQSFCEDVIDDWKNGGFYPSCCNGYGENGHALSCNGYHSCTG